LNKYLDSNYKNLCFDFSKFFFSNLDYITYLVAGHIPLELYLRK